MYLVEPVLILVDTRLLHGQVVTTYIRTLGILDVFIVDDGVFDDKVLQQIFELVKPPRTSVHFLSLRQAAQEWMDGTLAGRGNSPYMLLMRDIESVKALYEMGMTFKKIVISNLKAAPDKKRVRNTYYLNEPDIQILDDLSNHGVSVSFRDNISWETMKADYRLAVQ